MSASHNNVIRVKLIKQQKYGLGFLVRQRTKPPFIIVSDLVSGGTAAESGLIQIGDVVMRVNDNDLTILDYDKSLEILKSLPVNSTVVLILHGPEGYNSHLETRFLEDGTPKTIRVTKPCITGEGFLDRLKKTLTGVSSGSKAVIKNGECGSNSKEGCTASQQMNKKGATDHLDQISIGNSSYSVAVTKDAWAQTLDQPVTEQKLYKSSHDPPNGTIPAVARAITNGKESLHHCLQRAGDIPTAQITTSSQGTGKSLEQEGKSAQSVTATHASSGKTLISQCADIITLTIDRDSNKTVDDQSLRVSKEANLNGHTSNLSDSTMKDKGQSSKEASPNKDGKSGVKENGSDKNKMAALDVNHQHGDRRGSGSMPRNSPSKKFVKIRNVADERPVCTDTLHMKHIEDTRCNAQFCTGSLMDTGQMSNVVRPLEDVISQAKDFIDQYYHSIKRQNTQVHHNRWDEVLESLETKGAYELTFAELTYGAKTAWRNAARCIGRIQWSKLQVFDARHITTARGMFEAICNHIKYGTNKGNIRSALTVFPASTDGKHDFRVWNQQFIRYAGYKQDDGTFIGDPMSVEITEVCTKLGWKGKKTRFDILPLVLQANGHDPEMFDVPPDLILEVSIKHPKMPWFAEMGLKWFALPAVSNMMFDCGGMQFPGAPFNGWYMGTEIGSRDFCDKHRYNLLEDIAKRMGFDTRKSATLWKDRTLVEINVAVLHSFQTQGVTITDHHAASESFMKHLDNEQKLRGGCPADWVWVVPPMSGSITPVFHQEMLNYKLKPSFEYMIDCWKTHVWKKDKEKTKSGMERPRRKIGFRELARAVKFSAKLMGKALAKRVKCVILYGTETGKSEGFAKILCQIFKHAFDAKVVCMDEYDISELEHEALVLVVTSTFGNGDPPENGELFSKAIYEMKHPESKAAYSRQSSYVRMSVSEEDPPPEGRNDPGQDSLTIETGQLSNVRYSVFGLGSRAYPNFCAFGHYIDNILQDMGGERIYKMMEGDELCGQEESFRNWTQDVFKAACETFCVGDENILQDAAGALANSDHSWSPDHFRLTPANPDHGEKEPDIIAALTEVHGKTLYACTFLDRTPLQSKESSRQTLLIKLDTQGAIQLTYSPGDHVAMFPENKTELVDALLIRLYNSPAPDQLIKVECLTERATPLGTMKSWDKFPRFPICKLKTAFSRFLDLTTPPSQNLLKILAGQATKDCDKDILEKLTTDSQLYEEWKHETYPNIVQVLDQFSSLKVPPSLLLAELPLLQQRYYSISSSAGMFPGEIHGTVAVVKYRTQGETGPLHEGVCSSWLNRLPVDETIPCFVRPAQSFHMPEDSTRPLVLVGPGTGIAPFRSFWQQRKIEMQMQTRVPTSGNRKGWGEIYMYFGCRNSSVDDIYKEDLQRAKSEGVITDVYTALSREPGKPKEYVQDIIKKNKKDIYRLIVKDHGHFFVCGDVQMAADVTHTLESILLSEGKMTPQDAKNYILKMRDSNHFHEDIFGVTLRSSEVTGRARDQAKKAWNFVNSIGKSGKSLEKETVSTIPEKNAPKGKPKAPQNTIYKPNAEQTNA